MLAGAVQKSGGIVDNVVVPGRFAQRGYWAAITYGAALHFHTDDSAILEGDFHAISSLPGDTDWAPPTALQFAEAH